MHLFRLIDDDGDDEAAAACGDEASARPSVGRSVGRLVGAIVCLHAHFVMAQTQRLLTSVRVSMVCVCGGGGLCARPHRGCHVCEVSAWV